MGTGIAGWFPQNRTQNPSFRRKTDEGVWTDYSAKSDSMIWTDSHFGCAVGVVWSKSFKLGGNQKYTMELTDYGWAFV